MSSRSRSQSGSRRTNSRWRRQTRMRMTRTWTTRTKSAKCNSVWKPHSILPDTWGDLSSASEYFQMLPDAPGAKQSAFRLCKSILRCFWKHMQLWRSIQDTPLRRVKFWSSWDLCADLWDNSRQADASVELCGMLQEVPKPPCSSEGDFMLCSRSIGSDINTMHFILAYSSLLQSHDLLYHNMA
jgi:hypothetical protein